MNILKKYFYHIILVLLVGVIALLNYTPGTWLTGWDNLHPEFNFGLNIKRSIFSVWQEYQGLGLLAGMAHAADLPRQLFLWIVSLVMPTQLLRYFFHFLMLLVGILGVFYFLRDILLVQLEEKNKKLLSLVGGLFYLFNLGTIQYFFVPFEPYSTFWGFFPWEMYGLFKFLYQPTRRNLAIFLIINLLAIPQAYVQTIFLVYLICVGLIAAVFITTRKSIASLKTVGMALAIIFCVNAFWLIPNIYFVAKKVSVTQNAMQNMMATEKFFQMNKKRGTLQDYPVLKEFYYDFLDFNQKTNTNEFMMQAWRNHLDQPYILSLGYLFFGVILLGLLYKHKYRVSIALLFGLCSLIFLSDVPVIATVNSILRAVPLLNQIFRNPFTKFIVPTVFSFSILFTLGLVVIQNFLRSKNKRIIAFALPICAIFALLLYGSPIFKGQLISSTMRVQIPQEYFQLFSYFDTQDKNARIMDLPQGSYWGWYFYRWGVRGSGFMWYGIEQPIMSRTFDVWSQELEDYYWQLNYALKTNDKNAFNQILEKYHISYIIFDENLLFSDQLNAVKLAYNQKDFLTHNPHITLDKSFGNLAVYKVNLQNKTRNFVAETPSLPNIKKIEHFSTTDQLFAKVGNYFSDNTQAVNYFAPYQSLFTSRSQNEIPVQINENNQTIKLSQQLTPGSYDVHIPSFATENMIPVELYAQKSGATVNFRLKTALPTITLNEQKLFDINYEYDYAVPINAQNQSAPLIVSLNNKDFFTYDNASSDFKLLGKTYIVNSQNANYLRIYTQKDAHTLTVTPADFYNAKICGAITGPTSLSSKTGNTLQLNAKNTAICSVYKKSLLPTDNALVKVSYDYKSSSDEYPQYCYYSESFKTCLNNKDSIKTGFSNSFKTVTEYFEGSEKTQDTNYLNFILDATADEDKNTAKSIEYKNIQVNYFPHIATITLNTDNKIDTETVVKINVTSPATLTALVNKDSGFYTYNNPIKNNIYKKTPLNYDALLNGEFKLLELNNNRLLRTESQHASTYLLWRARDLNPGNGYLMTMKTNNVTGFPFTVNTFTNQNFRNYTYTYTTQKSGLQNNYFVLPPYYQFDQGIDVLLGGISYSSDKTINDIDDFEIQPLPYTFLTNIYLQRTSGYQTKQPLTPANAQKINSYTYKVDVTSNTYVVLSQSYDTGWLAFLHGKTIHDHILVNGWANGWILPKNSQGTLTIVYWPQYLEYIGLVLLAIGGLFLVFYKPKHND